VNDLAIGLASALWLGILTSVSPCPLATNIAALSYLSRTILHVRLVLLASLGYTVGRMIAYAVVGFLVITSLLAIPAIAHFLQHHMNKVVGPVLIIAGMVLLNIIRLKVPGFVPAQSKQERLARAGILLGPLALGFIFALSFCPVSAALFFGSLIPLALNNPFGEFFPFVYGLGTAIPVLAFSVLIAFGVESLSHWIRHLQKAEVYARKFTGMLFLFVGVYYVWVYWL
jgi:cytochrome c biogenesis protein CcdA